MADCFHREVLKKAPSEDCGKEKSLFAHTATVSLCIVFVNDRQKYGKERNAGKIYYNEKKFRTHRLFVHKERSL